jgi:hypothetical protein
MRADASRSAEPVGDFLPADDADVLGHEVSPVSLFDSAG